MTLATNGPDGLWAAAVFYASEDFDLYFLSAGHTRHTGNITTTPRVQGIQLAGVVELLSGSERLKAITLYQVKFAFLAQVPTAIQAAFKKVNWYRVRPYQLYFVDNSRGFGHRDEITLD